LIIFLDSYFTYKGSKKKEYDLQKLLLLGILLCPANSGQQQKARHLYNLLQDNLQPSISAKDKDINIVFSNLIEFSTLMIYQYALGKLENEKDPI
jgi:hypothetical protein